MFWLPPGEYYVGATPRAPSTVPGPQDSWLRTFFTMCSARWSVAGAEAVLKLRALKVSGDFDAYWCFHLDREHERNHASRYADGLVPDPIPKPRLRVVK